MNSEKFLLGVKLTQLRFQSLVWEQKTDEIKELSEQRRFTYKWHKNSTYPDKKCRQTWQAVTVVQPHNEWPFILSTISKTPPPSLLCMKFHSECKVDSRGICFIKINMFQLTTLSNKEYHVKIDSYEVGQHIPCSFVTCIRHLSKWS